MRIEAKPDTKLRSEMLSAFYHKGYAGPNYNLDDISAFVYTYPEDVYESLDLSFWDMSCTVNKTDKGYEEIKELLKK